MTADLLTRLEKSRKAYDEAVKRSERLITIAESQEKKHIEDIATLEAEEPKKFASPKNFGAKSQRRVKKAKEAYRQLGDESTDELKLRLEKCLNGFAMWGLQTVKWLKLDSLKRRLMSAKTSGSA
ncbi:hypothetical protein AXG93_3920s1010 [Marchantia polymorpha subsp. ruderalis]|uniref:Uncharacterized protein n=1 Tax=Marchantia polymorpha subsp. ruderalis TaxID=1480154 RepID=A0A176VV27_MARPO|nr:hypothetical protein AXG93_3920s1010 [Marchantia polymorpha subsp. ruderalis]